MTKSPYSAAGRTQRLIATARAVLAAFFLLAVWLDPSEPTVHARLTYSILAAYLGYALLLALLTWLMAVRLRPLQPAAHVFDLIVFALLMFLTRGPSSPFFVCFIFSLVCAELLWQWRGTLLTALAALAAVVSMALLPAGVWGENGFELNRFIIRVAYLAVVAVLLGYLGAHEQRLRGELGKLAAWPQTIPADLRALLQTILERVADILGAKRMLLAWGETEEPVLHLATWTEGNFDYTRRPHAGVTTLTAAPLAGKSFFCPDAAGSGPVTVHDPTEGMTSWEGMPFDSGFKAEFDLTTLLALWLQGEHLEGYLMALDRPQLSADDLLLGEVVAQQVRARLEHFYLLRQLQQAAAAEERVRLARDLHDGVLQFLTALALQLETIGRRLDLDAPAARQRLADVQQLIVDEQRELRAQIRALKLPPAGLREVDEGLAERLEHLAAEIRRRWGIGVEVSLNCPRQPVPAALAHEIYCIVNESLTNAAKHANASLVRVSCAAESHGVRIRVADNGRGFNFRGRYNERDLARMKMGPVNLMERISAIGGTLAIESSDGGALLEITLPLSGKGGGDDHPPDTC